jgi:serine phosphatase RsbU (regulator of sigma subunit)
VREAIARVDPAQPIHGVTTLGEIVERSVTLERVASFMTGFFALAALLMATLGMYGVVSYSVRQRTVEIGTRMALGAERRDLLALILGGGLRLAAIGIPLGGIAVAAAVWFLTRQFEIRDIGALPFAAATAIVAGVAGAASFFPAWRATRLSPLVAIRDQPGSLWESAHGGVRRVVAELSRVVTGDQEAGARFDGALVTGFVDAARLAQSNQEALQLALASLRTRIGSEWALLLEPGMDARYRCAAAAGMIGGPAEDIPATGFLPGRLRFHGSPLPFGRGDLEACAAWAREHNPAQLAEIDALERRRAAMAVPLRTRRELLGVLLLGPSSAGRLYEAPEKHAVTATADLFALMLENARLTDRIVEQEKLRRDLALAAEVQKRLLPDHPPARRAAELAAISVPARSVGGDYYDFLELDADRLGIALADVSGKGVAAALIMSVVNASLRMISADTEIPPPELVARMNAFLHRCTQANSYATFFYAQLDETSRRLRYVNAGHNPPFLVTANGGASPPDVLELSKGGTVIGLFEGMDYDSGMVDLQAGDVLVIFTDGVPEALNVEGEEFGEARLRALVRDLAPLGVPQISSRLLDELRSWMKGAAQHDDLTFVVMKVKA